MLEQDSLVGWVEEAGSDSEEFRQAVHTILEAIASHPLLKRNMIMKGGMLLAIQYQSPRYTKDIDFSTSETLQTIKATDIRQALNESLSDATLKLDYDLDCRVQSYKIRPNPAASFPSIQMKVGYAYKGSPKHRRLLANGSPTIVSIDYSLNELTPNIEELSISHDGKVYVYSLVDVIAEKYRSLLQQVIRNRNRRQDVFDIYMLLQKYKHLMDEEVKARILSSLLTKSKSRNINPLVDSLDNADIRQRAKRDYKTLENEVVEALPDFDKSYEAIRKFYNALPWG